MWLVVRGATSAPTGKSANANTVAPFGERFYKFAPMPPTSLEMPGEIGDLRCRFYNHYAITIRRWGAILLHPRRSPSVYCGESSLLCQKFGYMLEIVLRLFE